MSLQAAATHGDEAPRGRASVSRGAPECNSGSESVYLSLGWVAKYFGPRTGGKGTMGLILYFIVIAAVMLGLSHILPGFRVDGWVPALLAAVVLAVVNTILKPILFVLTLPFTILTLGLFLLVLNAMMLGITAWIVPGFNVRGFGTLILASLILAVVGMAWKSATRET